MKSILGLTNWDGPSVAIQQPRRSPFEQLLYTVFQQKDRAEGHGMVVAVTSPHRGAGVSWVTASLIHELAKNEFNSVARITSRSMRKLGEQATAVIQKSQSQPSGGFCDLNLSEAPLTHSDRSGRWEASSQYREDCVRLLRSEFDYSLIDCPSLRDSGDVLSVAPFVDGVLLVIEANRTRREQIFQAERAIEAARGTLLGHVLNKRTYEIPKWLYKQL